MHVFVTGASAGIGAALARELARRVPGARLSIVSRDAAALERVAADLRALGASAVVLPCDLSDPDAAEDVLRRAVEASGPVDVLVNNAGSQVVGRTASIDIAAAERSLVLDLVTPLRLVRAVLPAMTARGAGRIVNIASAAALAPTPGMTWYNAAKGGLAAASEALRGELAGSGVTVTTVYPGIVQTDMADAAIRAFGPSLALRLQPVVTAEVLAERVVRAALAGRARLVHPRFYALTRWFPAVTRWLMDAFTPALRETAA
ncbi:MAG: SDR family NAD(P)-dependent oxidoreductase [Alphaproteobacteria bacterium]|nr:SDR family NAD(P)-dependent oxidoreductase [Alphaproteobacteria bacterium]